MTSKTILGDLDVHPVKSHNMDLSHSLYMDGAKTFWDVACRPVLERGKRVTRRGGGEGYGEEEEK